MKYFDTFIDIIFFPDILYDIDKRYVIGKRFYIDKYIEIFHIDSYTIIDISRFSLRR